MLYSEDAEGYVPFGEVCRHKLNIQCQYGSRYVNGFAGYPDLGEGLRFKNLDRDYHDIKIHIDDIKTLVKRYFEYQASLDD